MGEGINMSTSEIWKWADMVCEAANTAARNGDPSLLNRLDTSWSFYFSNIYSLKTMTAQQFESMYPQYAGAILRDHAAYMREEEAASANERLSSIEQALQALQTAVAALTKQESPTKSAKKKVAPKSKAKPAPEPDEDEDEPDDEDESEDESED